VIPIDGRVAQGLDEFMLRLGHLVVVAEVCRGVTRRATRLEKEVGLALTRNIAVDFDELPQIAAYLATKGFCPNGEEQTLSTRKQFRYPTLRLAQLQNGLTLQVEAGHKAEVWTQDYYLSSPNIPSRVGAVTVDARSKSSTGLSHVIDWALILGLLRKNMEPSNELLLLGGATGNRGDNPYMLSEPSRLILANAFFRADLDILLRLALALIDRDGPIKKRDGAEIYASTVEQLCKEAADQRYLSDGKKFKVFTMLKELRNAVRNRKGASLGSSSTAWHRAASRLESLVDLGLLTKIRGGSDYRYEYVYFPTEQLRLLRESIAGTESARDWLENKLVHIFLPNAEDANIDSDDQVVHYLTPVLQDLVRPIQLFPIDALCLGMCCQVASQGRRVSLRSCRKAIEEFAIRRPAAARLSRGPLGDRAEFVSLNLNRL